jgi:glycosyltransferase involved in cell wall biosynthesis
LSVLLLKNYAICYIRLLIKFAFGIFDNLKIVVLQRNNKKKICLVVSSLGNGGVERSAALISKMLSNLGHDVHIVSVLDRIEYAYSGTLLNLGALKGSKDNLSKRLKRFRIFKNYLKTHKFDIILDSRSRPIPFKEFLIQQLIYKNFRVVYLIHSYKIQSYLPKNKTMFKWFFKQQNAYVTVSDAIRMKVQSEYNLTNIRTIYNAVDGIENQKNAESGSTPDFDFILFYGRLVDKIKNVTLLINAYKNSELIAKGIKLVILGNGPDEARLKEEVKALNLTEHIQFEAYKHNPFPFIKKARFTMLTSKYEGFPMVLPESLSVGTPVVSVDCKSGPNEIITNEKNGLLVKNNDVDVLSEAMNTFIFDSTLYHSCKSNAIASVEKFSIENISMQWEALVKEIT